MGCTVPQKNIQKYYTIISNFFHSIPVGKHSAQWALDDVLIGMNDSSRTGFHDKFDGTTPLRHNWYRIQGGEVTVDCLSLDTALTFNSEAIDSELHKHNAAYTKRRGLMTGGLSVIIARPARKMKE